MIGPFTDEDMRHSTRKVQLSNLPKPPLSAPISRHCGVIEISNEIIQAFLPKGTKVIRVLPPDSCCHPDYFHVQVEHYSFPISEEGMKMPKAVVEITADALGFIIKSEYKMS